MTWKKSKRKTQTLTGNVYTEYIEEKWIQRSEKLSILCSTFTTLGARKITTHTVKYNIFRQAEHISNVQFSPESHPQQETVTLRNFFLLW